MNLVGGALLAGFALAILIIAGTIAHPAALLQAGPAFFERVPPQWDARPSTTACTRPRSAARSSPGSSPSSARSSDRCCPRASAGAPLTRGAAGRAPSTSGARSKLARALIGLSTGERRRARTAQPARSSRPRRTPGPTDLREPRTGGGKDAEKPRPCFGPAGHGLRFYLVYGIHECMNVVAEDRRSGRCAVLIRGGSRLATGGSKTNSRATG